MLATKIKIVRDTWQPPTQKLSALPGGLALGVEISGQNRPQFFGRDPIKLVATNYKAWGVFPFPFALSLCPGHRSNCHIVTAKKSGLKVWVKLSFSFDMGQIVIQFTEVIDTFKFWQRRKVRAKRQVKLSNCHAKKVAAL